MYGAGDVRIADVPDPAIHVPADAIVRVVRAAICGSDLLRRQVACRSRSTEARGLRGSVPGRGASQTG
jgi:threonine dehydrogenase-like Zn-dependent dehydrogenase